MPATFQGGNTGFRALRKPGAVMIQQGGFNSGAGGHRHRNRAVGGFEVVAVQVDQFGLDLLILVHVLHLS